MNKMGKDKTNHRIDPCKQNMQRSTNNAIGPGLIESAKILRRQDVNAVLGAAVLRITARA